MIAQSFLNLVLGVSEFTCYIGCILSLVIAKNLLRMGCNSYLTFVNKMLALYYTIDAVSGISEVYFLFKLKRER